MSLESLYQDIILEHSKQRTGEHLVEVPAGHASADNHQYNPHLRRRNQPAPRAF